ncbi:hypothetical protein E2C01_048133 [Portunus trituberculatus]|uniref:Uncharacterized protein n=1 Tax=Portunus trituberculatus TaxID=210409 RepID=A0A5B7G9W8_PORTR|nr:hypothetical protein [Portunus trituberculatus]
MRQWHRSYTHSLVWMDGRVSSGSSVSCSKDGWGIALWREKS